MKLIHKITLVHSILFIIALLCAALAYWNANAAEFYSERKDLAHQSYQAHLSLSSHTNKLFKQLADTILIGDRDNGETNKKIITLINKDINNIRSIINAEIAMVGEEEEEELEALDELETDILTAITDYQTLIKNKDRSYLLNNTHELVEILDHKLDIDVQTAIDEALAEEQKEVTETNEEIQTMVERAKTLTLLFTAISIISAILALYLFQQFISKPLQRIIFGAKLFSAGNWQHRIQLAGQGELNEVAEAINEGASVANQRELSLNEINAKLASEVQAQTSELRLTMLNLEEQAKSRQRLLADVSHELRTPLTVIQGEIDVALRGKPKTTEEYISALKIAREATQHTTQLVSDMLFVARQEAGHSHIQQQKNDLIALVKNIINSMMTTYKKQNTTLTLKTDNTPMVFDFDQKRIRQVLLILLENSVHYGCNHVVITLSSNQYNHIISVADDGFGIPSEDQSQIFNRFFRGSNASQSYAAGSGLGLPVAKAIVEAHHGKIYINSEKNMGTEFIIELPKATQ